MVQTIEEYNKRRDRAQIDLKARKENLFEKFPRLKEIDREMKLIGIKIVKTVGAHPDKIDELTSQLKEKNIDLQIERSEILASNGYPVDYFEVKYSCNLCEDTGFIGPKRCRCFEQKLIDKAYEQSNLRSLVERENFDTFRMDFYSKDTWRGEDISPQKNIEGILLACINYAKNFDNHNKHLFFYGSPGLGKTFLSHAIAKELLERGHIVLYQTSSDLIDFIRKNKFDYNNNEENIFYEKIFQSDFLIIDDLGTENLTDFAKMELFNIINKRLLSDKKMLISTNLSLREIQENYPNRFTSRLLGQFELYKFFGEDIRLNRKDII